MRSAILALACIGAATSSIVGVLRPDIDLAAQTVDFLAHTASIGASSVGVEPGRSDRLAAPGEPVQLAQAEAPPPAQQAPQVDESALRYFASKGDKARLEAEIARLRALYPNWTPPADPLAIPQNADSELERMWQLYSEARYADVRKAIADRQIREAGWTPPADLLERLAVAERRAHLIAASDAKRFPEVVTIAADTPSLLTCSDVDILWRVAEAFAGTDRIMRARDAYTYILKNCTKEPERIATIQKAAALLSYADMQDLLANERTLADGTREFEPIRNDLARRFVAAGDEDRALVVAAPYLQRVELLVEQEGLASDAWLLGWYALRRDDLPTAERWFRKAYAIEDTASAAQGLALVLTEKKQPAEAEAVMHRWYETSAETKATYFAAVANLLSRDPPVPIEPEVLRRMAAAVLSERDAASAQQFGWYALAYDQAKTGEQWFLSALNWKPDDEPSAYGLAVARLQLKDAAGLRAVQALWQGQSERIAQLGKAGAPNEAPRRVLRTQEPVVAKQTAGAEAGEPRPCRAAQCVPIDPARAPARPVDRQRPSVAVAQPRDHRLTARRLASSSMQRETIALPSWVGRRLVHTSRTVVHSPHRAHLILQQPCGAEPPARLVL
ncbi:MAG TPA: hypothetical protein VM468_07580, partial [Mycoplana sp.]|nr:hypothetical protein [Mycoplana sp.]